MRRLLPIILAAAFTVIAAFTGHADAHLNAPPEPSRVTHASWVALAVAFCFILRTWQSLVAQRHLTRIRFAFLCALRGGVSALLGVGLVFYGMMIDASFKAGETAFASFLQSLVSALGLCVVLIAPVGLGGAAISAALGFILQRVDPANPGGSAKVTSSSDPKAMSVAKDSKPADLQFSGGAI